jgi:hypothetical protein
MDNTEEVEAPRRGPGGPKAAAPKYINDSSLTIEPDKDIHPFSSTAIFCHFLLTKDRTGFFTKFLLSLSPDGGIVLSDSTDSQAKVLRKAWVDKVESSLLEKGVSREEDNLHFDILCLTVVNPESFFRVLHLASVLHKQGFKDPAQQATMIRFCTKTSTSVIVEEGTLVDEPMPDLETSQLLAIVLLQKLYPSALPWTSGRPRGRRRIWTRSAGTASGRRGGAPLLPECRHRQGGSLHSVESTASSTVVQDAEVRLPEGGRVPAGGVHLLPPAGQPSGVAEGHLLDVEEPQVDAGGTLLMTNPGPCR